MNKIKKYIVNVIIVVILMIVFANSAQAGFADYDDNTADKQANEQLKEQQAEDSKNIGKSSNNFLENLEVVGNELSPQFDKQTVNYTIEKELEYDSIEISAVASDSKAKIEGNGVHKLQSGENNIKVDVIAENGIRRTYFIKLNKKIEEENLKLKKLEVIGVDNSGTENTISLDFKQDVFTYSCNVYNDVTKIIVNAESIDEKAKITIEGNENLKEGNNVIRITSKSNENDSSIIYSINVNRASATVETNSKPENNNLRNGIISVILIVSVLVVIYLLVKRPNKSARRAKKK